MRARLRRFLASPKLAIGLMAYLGVIAFLGSLVPQGPLGSAKVAEWVATHGAAEGVARVVGLHSAYTAWYFLIGVLLLCASTALCAFDRTRVAFSRFALLRAAQSGASANTTLSCDYSVRLPEGLSRPDGAAAVRNALGRLGIRAPDRDGRLVAASWPYATLCSALFHWALLVLFCALLVGSLVRSEGLIGVPVGEQRPDAPDSYGFLIAGPLHNWAGAKRTIGVEQLRLVYVIDGLDRGPTPLVSVSDPKGTQVARQFVYPNAPIRLGSLVVHPSGYGLSVSVALIGADGSERGRTTQVVDFAAKEHGVAGPADLVLTGGSPSDSIDVRVTVPLDVRDGLASHTVPARPRATFAYGAGTAETSAPLRPGAQLSLPDGSKLRLLKVGYYARLSVVDDPTVPFIYIALFAGLLGVSVALLARQRLIVVTVERDDEGQRLDVFARIWRNAGTSSAEIKQAIEGSLRPKDEERGA